MGKNERKEIMETLKTVPIKEDVSQGQEWDCRRQILGVEKQYLLWTVMGVCSMWQGEQP